MIRVSGSTCCAKEVVRLFASPVIESFRSTSYFQGVISNQVFGSVKLIVGYMLVA